MNVDTTLERTIILVSQMSKSVPVPHSTSLHLQLLAYLTVPRALKVASIHFTYTTPSRLVNNILVCNACLP